MSTVLAVTQASALGSASEAVLMPSEIGQTNDEILMEATCKSRSNAGTERASERKMGFDRSVGIRRAAEYACGQYRRFKC